MTNPPSPIQEILNKITVTTVYQVGTLPKVSVEISEVEAALLEYIAETIGEDEPEYPMNIDTEGRAEIRNEFRGALMARFGMVWYRG